MKTRAQLVLALFVACAPAFAPGADSVRYEAVRIVAPAQDATVHDNQGNVEVAVEVMPALRAAAGDRIVLLLDGRIAASGAKARFRLTGVDRGTHTLQAQVTAADGAVLLASAETAFHLWQASRLFPGRKK